MAPWKKSAKKVSKAVKKYVKKAIATDIENKYITVTNSFASGVADTNNTGSVNLISNIAQGVTLNTRVGMVVRPNYLKLKYAGTAHSSSANNVDPTLVRVIAFQTRQSDLATVVPTTANVLENVGTGAGPISPMNDIALSAGQYKILHDQTHRVDNGVGQTYFGKMLIPASKLNNIHFNGSAGTNVAQGAIYLLVISDLATANAPSLMYGWELSYDDA